MTALTIGLVKELSQAIQDGRYDPHALSTSNTLYLSEFRDYQAALALKKSIVRHYKENPKAIGADERIMKVNIIIEKAKTRLEILANVGQLVMDNLDDNQTNTKEGI